MRSNGQDAETTLSIDIRRALVPLSRALVRAARRAVLAYHLACARQDVDREGLRVPTGVWWCEHCGLVTWDLGAFVVHSRVHTA